MREAVAAYCVLAAQHGMAPVELAVRFVVHRPLVASAVIGATSAAQLAEVVRAAEQPPLSEELAAAVDSIHARYPNPTP